MRATATTQVLRGLLVAAMAAVALVALAPGTAHAATGVACQRTLSGDGSPVAIPDNVAVGSAIDAPEDGLVVSDLDVTVDLAHPHPQDLVIFLSWTSDAEDSRTDIRLFNHEDGGSLGEALAATPSDGLIGTVFDDQAATPISWGTNPFTGRFIPSKPLALGNGVSGGIYRLGIIDGTEGQVGMLDDWSVLVTYASCDFDQDGVEDHLDQCRDVTARTATGCPVTARSVAASYQHGRFRGALSSPVAGCKAGRAVSVFRVRSGADRRVGTTTTRGDGSWRIARPKKHGRYYATSAGVAVPDRAECPAVQSRTIRIR